MSSAAFTDVSRVASNEQNIWYQWNFRIMEKLLSYEMNIYIYDMRCFLLGQMRFALFFRLIRTVFLNPFLKALRTCVKWNVKERNTV